MISQEKAMSHRSSGGRADGGEPAGGSGSAIIETDLVRTQQMINACHIHQKCWQLQRTSATGEGRSPEEAVASTRGIPATLPCLLRITRGTSAQAVTQMCTHVTANIIIMHPSLQPCSSTLHSQGCDYSTTAVIEHGNYSRCFPHTLRLLRYCHPRHAASRCTAPQQLAARRIKQRLQAKRVLIGRHILTCQRKKNKQWRYHLFACNSKRSLSFADT